MLSPLGTLYLRENTPASFVVVFYSEKTILREKEQASEGQPGSHGSYGEEIDYAEVAVMPEGDAY